MKLGTNNITLKLGSINVDAAYLGTELVYSASSPSHDYFRIIARGDGSINFTIPRYVKTSDIAYISYSTDNGQTWTKTDNVNSTQINISVNVLSGDTVMWKGSGIRLSNDSANNHFSFFSVSADYDIEGNAMTLLNEDDFTNTEFSNSTASTDNMCKLFNGDTHLINASGMTLPATTLKSSCYYQMFEGCTNLATAPQLLATTLAQHCCYWMFGGCTNLTTAPILYASTLANYCYNSIFVNCSSLSSITCLATDISATNCTYGWVSGVASSGTFRKAASMNGWTTGSGGIPSNWTVIDYSS